jgi:maltose O-acetyltransferase
MSRWRSALAGSVAAHPVWSPRARTRLLRSLGVQAGPGVKVRPFIRFIGEPDVLSLGRGTFVNVGLTVGANAPVRVGDRVSIGPNVSLLPTTHEVGPAQARAGATVSAPVVVGDGTWIGTGVTVLGGVTIGSGCVVAAGAVVTHDCEPDALYGGVPARLIRRLDD